MCYTTKNRCTKTTWAKREAEILSKCKPLVIKNFSLTEYDDTLEDFIHNYLVNYNYKFTTAELNSLDTEQCSSGRLRSLIDIFLICKHYFSSCTLEEVKIALYKNYDLLSTQVCSTVHRRVYWLKFGTHTKNHLGDLDEFGLTINKLKQE
jgi:hypothetical protein